MFIPTVKLLHSFHSKHVKGVDFIFRSTQPGKHTKRAENMTTTSGEYGGSDYLSFSVMYNSINYMFDVDVAEDVTSNK